VLQSLDPLNLFDRTVYILVKLAPGADAGQVQAEIRRRLPYNDVHSRSTWARLSRNYWLETTGLGLSMFVTVFLGCLVGVVVVAQALYTSTMEHFKEFAMVKAMGGGNPDVYYILVKQAVIAALVGFAIGAALAAAARPAVTGLGLKMIVPGWFFLVVFAGTILMCLAASMVSYRRIAKAEPALVFRG
jgi:putative ABC transport system permease protein